MNSEDPQRRTIKLIVKGLPGTGGCEISDDSYDAVEHALERIACCSPVTRGRRQRASEPRKPDEFRCGHCRIFLALVGEGYALGHWGTVIANAVLLASVPSRGMTHATPSIVVPHSDNATFAYRLMFVKAVNTSDDKQALSWRPLHALDIDQRTSAPSTSHLVFESCNAHDGEATAVIQLAPYLDDILKRSEVRRVPRLSHTVRPQLLTHGAPFARGSEGRVLVLSMYGTDARRSFNRSEWAASLGHDVMDQLPHNATSLFKIVDVELQATLPAQKWVVPPTTALFAATSAVTSCPRNSLPTRRVRGRTPTSASSAARPASVERRGESEGSSTQSLDGLLAGQWSGVRQEPCCSSTVLVEPLREVPVLLGPDDGCVGIDSRVTTQWWRVSLDLDALSTGWTPIIVLRSQLADDESETVRVPLTPGLFSDHTSGAFTIPLWIGGFVTALSIQYLEITSFHHPENNASRIRSEESFSRLTLDTLVGHRGLGKTYTSTDATVMQQKLAENSLESFNAAHARGCQCVELDVMMTKDYTPILFHDPILQVAARGKQRKVAAAGSKHTTTTTDKRTRFASPGKDSSQEDGGVVGPSFTPYDTLPVAVHQLTYRQLNSALTRAYKNDVATPSYRLRELLIKHWMELLDIAHESKDLTPHLSASTSSHHPGSSTPPLCESQHLTPRLASSAFLRRVVSLEDQFSATRCQGLENSPQPGMSPPRDGLPPKRQPHPNQKKKGASQFADVSKHHRFITNHIPTLQELFDTTPSSLFVNLEIKFPFQPRSDHHLFLQTHHFEVNDFVDAILAVVFDHVSKHPDRNIVFSSFEPDVCIALMLKQCRFHVLFLCDTEERVDLKDYRSFAVETAIQFAHAHHMSGISMCALTLLDEADKQWEIPPSSIKTWARELGKRSGERVPSMDDIASVILSASAAAAASESSKESGARPQSPSPRNPQRPQSWSLERGRRIVRCSHAYGLKVWTWGDRNSDPFFAFVQSREMGVDAVISDNVPLWSNASVGNLQSRPPSNSIEALAT